MTIRLAAHRDSPLATLRQRATFSADLMDGVKLSSGPTLASDAFDDARIDKRQAYEVLKYAKAFFQNQASPGDGEVNPRSSKVRVGDLALNQALVDLLIAPIEAKPTTEQGKARKVLRETLGLSNRLNTVALQLMLGTYGPERLKGCHVIYNGHATGATLPLFPMLQALGLTSGGYRRSGYSGDKGAAPLFNMILSSLMNTAERDFNLGAQSAEHTIAELMTPGMVIVVNAGPMLTAIDLPPEVLGRIERGEIRFVLHNAADHKAFAELRAKYPTAFTKALAIDAANSVPKQMELERIGGQLAAHGDDASRRHHKVPLSESVAVVMGLGMMGRAIARNLMGNGVLPENIVVVDDNPSLEAVRWAGERGITIHPALPTSIDGKRRLANEPHGVVFIATNSNRGLDASHLDRLPARTSVINTNSQGLGVDVEGIYAEYKNLREADHDYFVWGPSDGDHRKFADMVAERPAGRDDGIPKAITFINTRFDTIAHRVVVYAPNLSDTSGQEALPTTPMMVTGICAIADSELKPRPDGRPHDFPFAPGDILRSAAVLTLSYDGPKADSLAASAAGSVTGSSHAPSRQT